MSLSWRDIFCCCETRKSGYHDMDKATSRKELEKQIDELQARIHRLESDLTRETKAKDDAMRTKENALQRLSEHVALNLADNNPNLVDLSDVNRPNNLVEKFSQLYDNEWTNACEVLKKIEGFEDDKAAVKLLLDIVMECFTFCRDKAATQLTLILKAFDIDLEKVSVETKKLIKDARKKITVEAVPFIQKEAQSHLQSTNDRFEDLVKEEAINNYINHCIGICWLMAVQDPPMALSADAGEDRKFQKSKFREYTKTGEFVDYFVWPSVLIQDGGNVMSKGIVQCCDSVVMESVETEMGQAYD